MTPRKLLEKYLQMSQDGIEYVSIQRVLGDLKSCLREPKKKKDQSQCNCVFAMDKEVFRCKKCGHTIGEAIHSGLL